MRNIIFLCTIFLATNFGLSQELRVGMIEFEQALLHGVQTRFTVRVVDDDLMPVEGANVKASLMMEDAQWITGQTVSNGLFSVEGKSRGEWHYGIRKDGYYDTRVRQPINAYKGALIIDGKWQPWDPVITTVLRRVINPIPMYAKKLELQIPVLDRAIGLDLVHGDWVDPYGQGKTSDILVTLSRSIVSRNEYTGHLMIHFDEPYCGVQLDDSVYTESEFRSRRFALRDGYSSLWEREFGYEPTQGSFGRDDEVGDAVRYIRTRQKLDERGELVEALYGKLYGTIQVRGVARPELPTVYFTYYLNPTPNDRNMEFDPDHNLFLNLKSLEEVTAP